MAPPLRLHFSCESAVHNKCHIKFILNFPENRDHFKKNTFLLVKNPKRPWELYYINHDKQTIQIDITSIAGLQEILHEKSRKNLTSHEKELAKEENHDLFQS